MPTRNSSSSNSLRADIAVLNPETGKMEFPSARWTDVDSGEVQKWTDYISRVKAAMAHPANQGNEKRMEYLKKEVERSEWAKEHYGKPRKLLMLGLQDSSPERKRELDELRAKSAVKEIIYRGQDAYESLDAKKAAEVIRQMRKEQADGVQSKTKWTSYSGSEGDGLYHTSPEIEYAARYGRRDSETSKNAGVIEGVIVSKHLLDLTPLTDESRNWLGAQPKFSADKAKALYEDGPLISRPFQMPATRENVKMYAKGVVDLIKEQYRLSFGKDMPETAGLRAVEKKKYEEQVRMDKYYDRKNENPYSLDKIIDSQIMKRGVSTTYMLLKLPFFKQLLKDTGFDCVKYKDLSGSILDLNGTTAYATVKPTQFKSYFGSKKVNPKSPNMFDAD